MSRLPALALLLAGGAALASLSMPSRAADMAVRTPAPRIVEGRHTGTEVAVFAGGCFWGVQGVFSHVKGVISTTAGYAGGTAATANYETVSTGATGHAESVRVVFDPRQVDYADLLRVYFSVVADPTLLNAQGPDEGTQYRSALFVQSPAQERVARAYVAQLGAARVFPRPIVTRVEHARAFFPAEGYHQQFMAKNPNYPYIVYNDRPKVVALKQLLPGMWRS